jgi:hypothetical protein
VISGIILRFFLYGKLRLYGFEGGSESDAGARFALRILRARERQTGVSRTRKISISAAIKATRAIQSGPFRVDITQVARRTVSLVPRVLLVLS